MPGDAPPSVTTGILVYDGERNCLLLEGQVLQDGSRIEIRVFDAWIPGLIERDSGGWFLITHDQVGIRLHTGLPARMYEETTTIPTSLDVAPELQPHILIVDDDPALLRALSRTIELRLHKIQVDATKSAIDALALLQQQQYDAVVCDIKMPGMDGLELLAMVHKYQPETPTVLITGHGEHELAIQALRGGAYDYIQKPIERDSFIAALLRAIQTCQLRRRVVEQQRALELHAQSLERLVQQRTHELVEAHATKDKVIELVSRELVSPIVHLKKITQLLRQKMCALEEAEIVLRSFVEIEQSLAHTETLVRELQETSLIETETFIHHRKRCNLILLCHTILQEIATTHNADITWETNRDNVEVEVDYEQIAQILRNMLMHSNNSIPPDNQTTITIQCSNREAIIAIRDFGSEAPLGVGFYLSRKILEQHQGYLEMQNFPENRRAFFIMIPLYSSQNVVDDQQDISSPVICATSVICYRDSSESSRHELGAD